MNRYLLMTAAAALMCCLSCSNSKKEADAAPEISVCRAVRDSVVIHKSYPGTLSADREVQLVARVDGYLRSKNYASGDYVRSGTVLFTIEDGNYRDQVTKARSDVATAEANLTYAEAHYKAVAEALKSDAVSRMEVEQARSSRDQCIAALEGARSALATAQTQLSYCTIRAPFDGHVSKANYDVGAFVGGSASPQALASIYEDKTMIVTFSIDDSEALGKLKANLSNGLLDFKHMPISFSEELPHSYTASLDYLSPNIDTSTGTLTLQATIDNSRGELRSGMFATLQLPVAAVPDAVLVKDASIGADQLGSYIYVVNDSNRVVYTPVVTGELVEDSLRVISSGLSAGTLYVDKALLKVRDGMTVKPNIK